MKKLIVNTIAILLIVYGVFGGSLLDLLDRDINPIPEPPNVTILNIDKPSAEVINSVMPLASAITDPTDKAKMAIFNYEFATRILDYNTNLQQVNDVYVLAAKTFFKDAIVGKYKDLPVGVINLIESVTGKDNHILTQEEKQKLNEKFMGFAWALIQKGK